MRVRRLGTLHPLKENRRNALHIRLLIVKILKICKCRYIFKNFVRSINQTE